MKLHRESDYPWQQRQWQHLLALIAKAQMPHALLLVGYKGLGKLSFAQNLAKALLCLRGNSQSCNNCRNCHLFDTANHPDYTLLSPQADATAIKIDDVRQLIQIANQTPQQATRKAIVIEPAEAMNIAAANALLKVLEEPPGQTIFLLVCHQLNQVPATIRSRCQMIKFTAPTLKDGCSWVMQQCEQHHNIELLLSLADGSPLLALQLMQAAYLEQRSDMLNDLEELLIAKISLIAIAEKWVKKEWKTIIKLLLYFSIDMIRLKSGLNLNYIVNKDTVVTLQALSNFFELDSLYWLLDKLYQMQRLSMGSANINQQLLLEDFLTAMVNLKDLASGSVAQHTIGND